MTYRMQAEWEKHGRTWLAWPHHRADWPGKFPAVPWVFAEMARHLSRHERVGILAQDTRAQAQAESMLERAGAKMEQVDFLIHPTNRGWLRDCGPTIVRGRSGKRTALDWRFNAWAKYRNWQKDETVAKAVAAHIGIPVVQPLCRGKRVVMEGGAIDVNGVGALLTTEECLLSSVQCRNPGFSREDYEAVFAEYLGIEQVIWLGRGIAGDDTHGHVDDIARFTDADTIVTVCERDRKDDNHAPLEENRRRLQQARNLRGRPYTIIELPMPRPVFFDGERLPASYANFLIANNIVLMPTFNDPADRTALSILAELFPGREIIGIHALDLVLGLGTIHCLTQQEPM